MLFNSYVFIFIFLPLTLIGFYLIRYKASWFSITWLVICSLFFYAWWNPYYLGLILCSLLFNYAIGKEVDIKRRSQKKISRKAFLIIGIVFNLGLLGYFKYTNFFVDNMDRLFHLQFNVSPIVLPLAISFFTFQQIAYLMDVYRGEGQEHKFLHYCLFVTFFPHLIAGPLVHHKEMLPQFTRKRTYFISPRYFALGITIFIIGLFKKLLIADKVGHYADAVFKAPADFYSLNFPGAWCGILAYAYQIYFDFSGYSDMAIGLALLFGIRLPLNFYSPYKAVNVIDFWKRWHMSLSRFLFTYLYLPLGGNRKGVFRQCVNLMIVMCLGGLWHGARWGFIIWGALHGIFLIINHLWRLLRVSWGQNINKTTKIGVFISRCLTFALIMIAWVFFRAENVNTAMSILRGMAGQREFVELGYHLNHLQSPTDKLVAMGVPMLKDAYFEGGPEIGWVLVLSLIVLFAPNTHQIMGRYRSAFNIYRGDQEQGRTASWLQWRPTVFWAIAASLMALLAILHLSSVKAFIYFQF
jgi:alginate O-acetyltransferase complex protein AlgI